MARVHWRNDKPVPYTKAEEAEADAMEAAERDRRRSEILPAAIKREAGRRILNIAPEWKQRNMIAASVEMLDKGKENLTAEEQSDAAAMRVLWANITAIRDRSDVLEASIAAMTDEEIAAFNPSEDRHWV